MSQASIFIIYVTKSSRLLLFYTFLVIYQFIQRIMPSLGSGKMEPDKNLSGAGDGINADIIQRKKLSTPVPSERKIHIQVPSVRKLQGRGFYNESTKEKLKNAIEELSQVNSTNVIEDVGKIVREQGCVDISVVDKTVCQKRREQEEEKTVDVNQNYNCQSNGSVKTDRDNLAKIRRDNLAKIRRDNLAKIEKDKLDKTEKDKPGKTGKTKSDAQDYREKVCFSQGCTPRKMNNFEKLAVPKGMPKMYRNVTVRPKKALTVAEIMPSRSWSYRSLKNADILSSGVRSASPARRLERRPSGTGTDEGARVLAGRRVYQMLLLNAWRRRRRDVETLTDSCGRMRQQVTQLEMQVDVLQKLRESESLRRSEVSSLNTSLQGQVEFLQAEQECEQKRYEESLKLIENLQQKLEEMKTEHQNVQNELKENRSELKSYERQMNKERKKLNEAKSQRDDAQTKIVEYSKEIDKQNVLILNLEKNVAELKHELDLMNVKNEEVNIEADNLEKKLRTEEGTRKELIQQLHNETKKWEKARLKIIELKHTNLFLKESKRKLIDENESLSNRVDELLEQIRIEKETPWWKTAGRFLIGSLQNSAYLMLPALPRDFNFRCPSCVGTSPYLRYF